MAFRSVLIRWRVRDVVGDTTADSDVSPDPIPLPDGTTVTLKPAPMELAAPTSVPPITYYPQTINCRFNSDGDLVGPVDSNGDLVNPTVIGVAVVDPNDGDLQPHGWTIGVSVTVPGKRAPVSFNATLMTSEAPDPADTGNPDQLTVYWLTRNSPVPAYAGSATDASVYATAAAGSASDAAASAASVQRGLPGGVASLDSAGLVPVGQVPDLSGTYAPALRPHAGAGRFDPATGLYMPTGSAGLPVWDKARAKAAAGAGTARLVVVGDSITFGQHATPHAYSDGQVARLRAAIDAKTGHPAGSGVSWLWTTFAGTDWTTDDNRLTITSGIEVVGYGPYELALRRMNAPVGSITFVPEADCDGFDVYCIQGVSTAQIGVQVDGGAVTAYATGGATENIPMIIHVDAGSLGPHTLTVTPAASSVYVAGVASTVSGGYGVAVTGVGAPGKQLANYNTASADGHASWEFVTQGIAPHLTIIQSGHNEYLGSVALASQLAALTTATQRALDAGSDVLLMTTVPNADQTKTPTQAQVDALRYQVADDLGVPVLDLGWLWGTYAADPSLYYDGTHPDNAGYQYIADRMAAAITG